MEVAVDVLKILSETGISGIAQAPPFTCPGSSAVASFSVSTIMSYLLLRSSIPTSASRTSVRYFSGKTYENIIASRPVPSVALLTLNRPKALNALSTPLFRDLNDALLEADAEAEVGAIIITGSEKAFAGASSMDTCRGTVLIASCFSLQ